MPMQEWIHKYPGVAALLDHQVEHEEAGALGQEVSVVSPVLDLPAWIRGLGRWADACMRQYNARSLYILAAPDLYVFLVGHAAHSASEKPLTFDSLMAGQDQLRLYGLIYIRPWHRCPGGTWVEHWSDQTDWPRMVALPRDTGQWCHAVGQAVAPAGCEREILPMAQVCWTQRPILVCPCGGYVLDWR